MILCHSPSPIGGLEVLLRRKRQKSVYKTSIRGTGTYSFTWEGQNETISTPTAGPTHGQKGRGSSITVAIDVHELRR
ncbi:hypothetical protein BH09PAT1_BH09PAT1_1860 [soil metagenome]